MRLSSLFQRSRPAETSRSARSPQQGKADRNDLWRKSDFRVHPLGPQVHAAQIRGAHPRNLPTFAIEFALSCEKFRRLDQHLTEHAEKNGWDSLQMEALERCLPELIEYGLLVSASGITRRGASLGQPNTNPPRIETIGFPTGGNRTAFLERAVRGFAENARAYGRQPDFLISDNSPTTEQSGRFRALAAGLTKETGSPILFAGEEEKRRFAAALIRGGQIDPEAVEFALFDPLKTGFSCGANRNALLLASAGRMICSIDDDVICRMAVCPEPGAANLFCFSDRDPYARWLYPDREATLSEAKWVDRDFLGLHEEMLGRDASAFFQDGPSIDFTMAGDEFLRRIHSVTGTVRATYTGHIGDPGIPTSTYYLYYDEDNRRRLVESEAHYRSVFGSRSVLSVVSMRGIGDASVSPGMAMAFDQRELIPPFFPVLHAEDFSHGAALWQCCPGSWIGHLPVALYHEPGTGKPILLPGDLGREKRAVIFEFAHLLRGLILSIEMPEHLDAAGRMRLLSRQLAEHATLPPEDFAEFLRDQALMHASGRCEYLARELDEDHEAPDFWREDVEALIEHLRDALTDEDAGIPLDMKGPPLDETRALMQKLIGSYALLLQEWPGMVEAARECGERLFVRAD